MSDTPLADALKDQYCMSHLVWYNLCGELERELAALRADRDRLDWLMTHEGGAWIYWACEMGQWTPEVAASRVAIDAERKEAQP